MRALLCITLLALTAGCATTTSGEPVFSLRPQTAAERAESVRKYTGGLEAVVSFPSFDDVGANEFKNPESAGFRIHARPTHWYVAPEGGVMVTDEHDGAFKLDAFELFAGGRVTARFSELPVEVYANGGLSYLDSEVGPSDDTSTGYYIGAGVNLVLGGEGLTVGGGVRRIDHDWDLDEWTEVFVNIGLSW